MATWFTTFDTTPAGTQPAGWTRWIPGSVCALTVEAGHLLRLLWNSIGGGSGLSRAMWLWTAGPVSATGETVEVMGPVRVTYAGAPQYSLVVRGSLNNSNHATAVFIPGSTRKVGIAAVGFSPWATADFPWVEGQKYMVGLRAEGSGNATVYRLKVWPGLNDPPPAAWTVSTGPVSSPDGLSAGGYVGVALQGPNSGTATVEVDWIGVTTGGAAAPGLVTSAPVVTVPPVVAPRFAVAWSAVVDAAQPAAQMYYDGEYRKDGGAWTALFTAKAGEGYTWDASAHLSATSLEVRVRARTADARLGPWGQSAAFSLYAPGRPFFLVENLLSTVQFPTHVLSASSEAAGAAVWRVADGRRSQRDRWTPGATNVEAWLRIACAQRGQPKAADVLVLDRGHNLGGRRIILEVSNDGFATTIPVLDVVVPATSTRASSVDRAAGAATPEGAWLKRFPAVTASDWRIRIPAMGVGLRPEIVGLWLGESWQPRLLFDLPWSDSTRQLTFQSVESDAGWTGRGPAARPRTGEIGLKLQTEDEYQLAERHVEAGFWALRPMWIVHDSAAAERAVLAVPPAGRYGFGRQSGWSYKQAQLAWVEHEPKVPR